MKLVTLDPVTASSKSRPLLTRGTFLVVALAIVINVSTIMTPNWAVGASQHLTSSRSFQMNLAAGLWGYCRTATLERASASSRQATHDDCYTFHTITASQRLTVCNAYARGFVYGTDDVRGIRLPVNENADVRRIPRPPTSLDDVHLQEFIERACGVEGTALVMVTVVGLAAALLACGSLVITHAKQTRQGSCVNVSTTNCFFLCGAAMGSLLSVLVWIHQSTELRRDDDVAAHNSIHLGPAAYWQLLSAKLYAAAALLVFYRARQARAPLLGR